MVASGEPLHGYQPGLTIGQAASRLSISPSTVRRWVRSGRLRATQVTVGDGYEYRIPLEVLEGVKTSVQPSEDASTNPSTDSSMNGSIPTTLEASVERSTAVAAYNSQLLAPLVTVIERQAEQLVSQAETLGRVTAERDQARAEVETLRASQAKQEAQEAHPPVTPTTAATSGLTSRWRALAPWLLVVLAIVAVIVLLVWPR